MISREQPIPAVQQEEPLSYLLFRLHDAVYAVDVRAVREITWLPALSPIEEVPRHVVGVFDLRGCIVPVMDLALRFGHVSSPYRLEDSVVVLEADGRRAGVIVNEALDVCAIPRAQIQPPTQQDRLHPHLLTGECELDGTIVMLLDHVRLLHPDELGAVEETPAETSKPSTFMAAFTAEQQAVLRERSHVLRQPAEAVSTGKLTLVIIELAGEYFGVPVETVQEFAELGETVPVPCSPAHIAGYINLRGNVLTLLDMRHALSLHGSEGALPRRLVIANSTEGSVAIPVDGVREVLVVESTTISPMPVATAPGEGNYAIGTIPYQRRIVIILDMDRLLGDERLVVNETV
ncbi:MAG: chemotaxis protein CheW [Gammaproteobacteria bacterium]|nr:chemotaxis protein CheW [Gammaproteobacteria bacterium]